MGGAHTLQAAAGEQDEYGWELLEVLDGEFDPKVLDEAEIEDMLEPFQASFRRLGGTPRKPRPALSMQSLDMEKSLKAQSIHNIEELMQALQGESDKNRK